MIPMTILIDTTVILDILEQRASFFESSYEIIQLGIHEKVRILISANGITDIYQVINRRLHDADIARAKILEFSRIIEVTNTMAQDIHTALTSSIPDFESAVLASIAKRENVRYIVTRNEANFAESPVTAMSPEKFIAEGLRQY
ncbi:MAG: PIN domain-containing protein [Spirochaetaceae bacterium]|jgi:predicted nucleic acid-binding protein|nr:PIN domain-containing protein [Spirochaetaceae bacterium]